MIPILHEPLDMALGVPERCCFCRSATRFWTALPDRTPGQQVACCETCAGTHWPVQVPSKEAWFDLEAWRGWAAGVHDSWRGRTKAEIRARHRRHARAP
jgi:hypothetical protein